MCCISLSQWANCKTNFLQCGLDTGAVGKISDEGGAMAFSEKKSFVCRFTLFNSTNQIAAYGNTLADNSE